MTPKIREVTFWTLGSVASAQWEELIPVAVALIPAVIVHVCAVQRHECPSDGREQRGDTRV